MLFDKMILVYLSLLLGCFCAISDCYGPRVKTGCQLDPRHLSATEKMHLSETVSGRTCQRWSSQSPHLHRRLPERYKEANLTENFCRNPDGYAEVWCYTTDPKVRWELCVLPKCNIECVEAESRGWTYRGTQTVTVSGRTCQDWDEQTPHRHSRTKERYPHSGLEGNYCRNPGDHTSNWCYTTDKRKRWEECSVPVCNKTVIKDDESDKKKPGPQQCYRMSLEKTKEYNITYYEKTAMPCVEDSVCVTITATSKYKSGPRYQKPSVAVFGSCFPKSQKESVECWNILRGQHRFRDFGTVGHFFLRQAPTFLDTNCTMSFCEEDLCNDVGVLPEPEDDFVVCPTGESFREGRRSGSVSSTRVCPPHSSCFSVATRAYYGYSLWQPSVTKGMTGCLRTELCDYLTCDNITSFLPNMYRWEEKVNVRACNAKCCTKPPCSFDYASQETTTTSPIIETTQPDGDTAGLITCYRTMYVNNTWNSTMNKQNPMRCRRDSVCLLLVAEGYDSETPNRTAVAVYGTCFPKASKETAKCEDLLRNMGQRNAFMVDDYNKVGKCSLTFCEEDFCNAHTELPVPAAYDTPEEKSPEPPASPGPDLPKCLDLSITFGPSWSSKSDGERNCEPGASCYVTELQVEADESWSGERINQTKAVGGCFASEFCDYMTCDRVQDFFPGILKYFNNHTLIGCKNTRCCKGDLCNELSDATKARIAPHPRQLG